MSQLECIQALQLDYTLGAQFSKNPYHVPIIRTQFTRAIPHFVPELHEEVTAAFNEFIPLTSGELGLVSLTMSS